MACTIILSFCILLWILLMGALRALIKLSNFRNILSGIEKVLTVFSIPDKMFLKFDNLMCALRAHSNQTLLILN